MKFEDMFPMKFDNGQIYYLSKVLEYNTVRNKSRIVVYDNDNYYYITTPNQIKTQIHSKNGLKKFMFKSPYIKDNINNFFQINDIPLFLHYIPKGSDAKSILYLIRTNVNDDEENDELFESWNNIQSNPSLYLKDRIDQHFSAVNSRNISKEWAESIIRNKELELGRPLLQIDFENSKCADNSIGIRTIYRFWGNFNNMIKELGLLTHDSYFKPNNPYSKSLSDCISIINDVCNYAKEKGRNIIFINDFKEVIGVDCIKSIRNQLNREGISFEEILGNNNCSLQRPGCGLRQVLDGNELIQSNYELRLSNILRENGFIYNHDYFRDIKYSDIDDKYTGNMTCDYKIIFHNEEEIYLELAGFLGNKEYEIAYYNNEPLKDPSKEIYRKKLYIKKDILERNGLNYKILFPSQMKDKDFRQIINNKKEELYGRTNDCV